MIKFQQNWPTRFSLHPTEVPFIISPAFSRQGERWLDRADSGLPERPQRGGGGAARTRGPRSMPRRALSFVWFCRLSCFVSCWRNTVELLLRSPFPVLHYCATALPPPIGNPSQIAPPHPHGWVRSSDRKTGACRQSVCALPAPVFRPRQRCAAKLRLLCTGPGCRPPVNMAPVDPVRGSVERFDHIPELIEHGQGSRRELYWECGAKKDTGE
jgi:hypothetical protein